MKTTFALIKPDGVPHQRAILGMLKKGGFTILQKKLIKAPRASQVAAHLEDLRFRIPEAYDRNFPYLLGGPVIALSLGRPKEAIKALRELAGPTDPPKADKKSTIRGRFGKDSIELATREGRGLQNTIHTSDSEENAAKETKIWI